MVDPCAPKVAAKNYHYYREAPQLHGFRDCPHRGLNIHASLADAQIGRISRLSTFLTIGNQLRPYGRLNYLAKGREYEVDFILTREERSAGLEVKYHPIQSDDQKLKRIAAKHDLGESWLVGKYPTPGFSDFIWGGSIF